MGSTPLALGGPALLPAAVGADGTEPGTGPVSPRSDGQADLSHAARSGHDLVFPSEAGHSRRAVPTGVCRPALEREERAPAATNTHRAHGGRPHGLSVSH